MIFDEVIGMADVDPLQPYTKMALGVLSCSAKIILAQMDYDAAVLKLLEKLGQVYDFIARDQILGQISSMHAVLGNISTQTYECAYFIKIFPEVKKLWSRLERNVVSETDDIINKYNDVFDRLMDFQNQHTYVVTHICAEKIWDLRNITYAGGAGLDCRKECLQGTRTEILSEITEWINSTEDNVPCVLWLSGPAGKGKSAIAHIIAKCNYEVGGLSSCYSFDRQREAERRHEKIFSTIALKLAGHDPGMRRALVDAVMNGNALNKKADIIQQWQKLLIEPLEKSYGSTSGEPIVIVIDALDESGGVETRRDLLHIIAGKYPNPAVPKITDLPGNLRFIVTSRPLGDIQDEFRGVKHIRAMSMDDIPLAFATRDIHAYVSQKLHRLKFQDRELSVLAEQADGVFGWANIACRYIKENHVGLSRTECYNSVVSRDPDEREPGYL